MGISNFSVCNPLVKNLKWSSELIFYALKPLYYRQRSKYLVGEWVKSIWKGQSFSLVAINCWKIFLRMPHKTWKGGVVRKHLLALIRRYAMLVFNHFWCLCVSYGWLNMSLSISFYHHWFLRTYFHFQDHFMVQTGFLSFLALSAGRRRAFPGTGK